MPRSASLPPAGFTFLPLTIFFMLNWGLTLFLALYPITASQSPWLSVLEISGWTIFALYAAWVAFRHLLPLIRQATRDHDILERLAQGDLRPAGPDTHSPAQRRLRTFCINDRNAVETISAYSKEFERHSEQASAMAQAAKAKATDIEGQACHLSDEMEAVDAAAEEVAHHIGSITAAVDQMHQASDDIATNMEHARDAAEQAAQAARDNASRIETLGERASQGATGLRQVSASITGVRDQAAALKRDMDALGRDSQSIGAILGVIADIADQTNLLALNAAIEAARAGESGRGFAVVADEVRKLAEKTMAATKDVETAVRSIQSMASSNLTATESAVGAIEDSMHLAERQIGETDDLMQAMLTVSKEVGSITTIVDALKDMVFTSSSAAEEHSKATAEIAGSLTATSEAAADMRDRARKGHSATQTISEQATTAAQEIADMATAVQQVNSAARELTHLTGQLSQEIEGFHLGKAPFDVATIKNAHLAWRARLESVLLGLTHIDVAEMGDHHQCPFGKWYDGEGKNKFATIAAFKEIGKYHERVHALAKIIAGLASQNKKEEAASRMEEFEAARVALFEALNTLYLEMTP